MYANLDEVVEYTPPTSRSHQLKQFVREFPLEDQAMRLDYSNGHFIDNQSRYQEGKFLLQFRCKKMSIHSQMDGFAKLQLSNNAELFNQDWNDARYLVYRDTFYLSLEKSCWQSNPNPSHQSALASCRIALNNTSLDIVSAILLKGDLSQFDFDLLPGFFDYRFRLEDLNFFVVASERVFAVTRIGVRHNCIKIHCFYRTKILPIGGTNVGSPGIYVFSKGQGQNTKQGYFYSICCDEVHGTKTAWNVCRLILT